MNTDASWLVAADAWLEAGNAEHAKHMTDMRPSEIRKREDAYRERERKEFLRHFRAIEATSKREARSEIEDLLDHLRNRPDLVVQQLNWLINGSYGHGAKMEAARIIRGSARSNRAASLMGLVSAMAFNVPTRFMRGDVWRGLTPVQQQRLTTLINREIQAAHGA